MKKIFTLFSFLTVALLTMTATAQKTITLQTNDPAHSYVYDSNYNYPSWDNGKIEYVLDQYTLTISATSSYEIVKITKNGDDTNILPDGQAVSTFEIYSYDNSVADGDVFSITIDREAPKLFHFKTDDSSLVSVAVGNETQTWGDGNSMDVSVPVDSYVVLTAADGYYLTELIPASRNYNTIYSPVSSTSIYPSSFPKGETFTIKVAPKPVVNVVVVGDPKQVEIVVDGVTYGAEKNVNGQWRVEKADDKGRTSINALEGFALESVVMNGRDYFNSYNRSSAQVDHYEMSEGDNFIEVKSYNIEESRRNSVKVNVEGDASNVVLKRAGDNKPVELVSGENTVKYLRPAELPFSLTHKVSGMRFYKVDVDGTEIAGQGYSGQPITYDVVEVNDNSVITVKESFPEKNVKFKMTFEGNDAAGAVKGMAIDGTPLEKDAWLAEDFSVKLGAKVSITFDRLYYNIGSMIVNGSYYSSYNEVESFQVYEDRDYTVAITANKYPVCKVTVKIDDPTHIILKKDTYSSGTFELTGTETVIDVPMEEAYDYSTGQTYYKGTLYPVPVLGWKVSSIKVNGEAVQSSYADITGETCTVEIATEAYERPDRMSVYLDDASLYNNRAIVLQSYSAVQLTYEIETGYSFVYFNNDDIEAGISTSFYPYPTVYLNGSELAGNYGSYDLKGIKDGDVMKIFVAAPAEYNVTFDIDEAVTASGLVDRITPTTFGEEMTVLAGTEIEINGYDDTNVELFVDDVKAEPADNGNYVLTVNAPTAVKIVKTVGISTVVSDSDAAHGVYNLQGIRVAADGDLSRLPAGIYIVSGRKVVVK